MTDTQEVNNIQRTRRAGIWLIALSLLLFAACVFTFWLHPPEEATDNWIHDPIPWDLWTVTLFTAEEWLPAFGPPSVVGLLQFIIKPCLPNTILRWLAYAWLTLLWGMYSFVLLTFYGMFGVWLLLVVFFVCWFVFWRKPAD